MAFLTSVFVFLKYLLSKEWMKFIRCGDEEPEQETTLEVVDKTEPTRQTK
jgi:hypothetical protein